jgi:EAL domain-containing protein (putative c-di-GMP-specific phosphodiesterase class I)
LDSRIVSALVDDIQALDAFINNIYKNEDKVRRGESQQYGIGLRYEKVMEITSNKVSAYRVKLIVNDPYYGVMRAEQLLPVAEKTGQIFRFEKIAFEKLCMLLEIMEIRGTKIPNIIFPISAFSLERKTFFKDYGALISKYHILANRICFGVSERSINETSVDLSEKINAFKLMGCRFSIEDFSDQLSLIESIGEHQIDSISFNSSYGKRIANDTKTSSILTGLTVIADRLGIRVILNGIENQNAELSAVRTGIRYASGTRYGEELTDKELVAELNS